MQEWKKIGQILIENGTLSAKTATRMLDISKRYNKRFGWTLEKLGLVTGEEMAAALAQQSGLKMVTNLTHYTYPQELLDLISYEVALQHLIFPLKQDNDTLLLAVADPHDIKIVDNLAANTGLKIAIYVASRTDLYAAICKYYLGKNMQEPQKPSVLVVEDEATSQELVRQFLAKSEYSVIVANDGMEAFREVIASKPHVILTDKVMPKLDGFSLLKSIQAIPEFESIPVILMSDKLSEQEEMKVVYIGFFDYIPKPSKNTTLLSRVKRAFRFSKQKYEFF